MRKHFVVLRDVLVAVIDSHIRQHFVHDPARLHGAQALVINGDGARRPYGGVVALYKDDADASFAEQISQRKAGGAGADDDDVAIERRHYCTDRLVMRTGVCIEVELCLWRNSSLIRLAAETTSRTSLRRCPSSRLESSATRLRLA